MSTHHTQKNQISQSVSGIFPIYKKAGESLANLLDRFRLEQNLNKDTPITYAGRLDPMAEGLVILLTGEKCKEKDSFNSLEKTYEFKVLFGISTDTFDMLGLIDSLDINHPSKEEISQSLETIKNLKEFTYPAYSSKPVGGIPLFSHAKAGTLPVVLPIIKGEIKELFLKEVQEVSLDKAISDSISIIKKVDGDFRQDEIIKSWNNLLENKSHEVCVIATLETTVTSGVYVRTIATLIGQYLGVPALAYSIKRVRVGQYRA
jgi:tRNA pseudouridine(55) synthase